MDRIIYFLVAPLLIFISRLPFWFLYLFSNLLYPLIYYVFRYRRKVVRKNIILSGLSKNKKQLLKIERNFYRYLCDLFLEMIKVRGMSKKEMMSRFKITNPEILENYAKQGKSVFVMTGHYANFEWLLSLGHHVSLKPYGIYAPLENKFFDNYIKKVRSLHGSFLISRKRFSVEFTAMQRAKELSVIGFAADQSPRKNKRNHHLTFFDNEVPVFTGAERLGKEFKVPILMAKIKRVKRGYYETTIDLLADDPTTVPDYQITETYYKALENQIKENPTYYFWTHNRFKLMRQKQQ